MSHAPSDSPGHTAETSGQPVTLARHIDPENDSAPVLSTFFRIMDVWAIYDGTAIALLSAPPDTYFRWKADPDTALLSHDQFLRLSYIFGIYKAVQILFPTPASADSWVKLPNSASVFGGKRPIELMAGGRLEDLGLVRQFLDGERWG